jgi:hypothetical protein
MINNPTTNIDPIWSIIALLVIITTLFVLWIYIDRRDAKCTICRRFKSVGAKECPDICFFCFKKYVFEKRDLPPK